MKTYTSKKAVDKLPRLPLEGSIDLTYRCNNNCKHCWLWIPPNAPEAKNELSLEEIKDIVDEARGMGCREWSISGGEPMLRPDFEEIFDYITNRSIAYKLNTNGTLITPKIAQLMRKPGRKMVALYGATAEVHDGITRTPGSFEAMKRGVAYLKEAKTAFIVQIVPMKGNYFQYQEMLDLGKSMSPDCREGAPWLYLSASGDPQKNREIIDQRLDPAIVVGLQGYHSYYEKWNEENHNQACCQNNENDRLFTACITSRRNFHIDPYGKMSFCSFVKSPELLYDIRQGSLQEGWNKFIPSLVGNIRGDRDYLDNCGSCESINDCGWCPVYGYIENRNLSAKVEYLCAIGKEVNMCRENWLKNHRRCYQVGGITIQLEADLPITADTFTSKFKIFEVDKPGEDIISIRHHFHLPSLGKEFYGKEVYRKEPWAVYQKDDSWIYEVFSPENEGGSIYQVAVFNQDFSRGKIYNRDDLKFKEGNCSTLTLFSTDQILLTQIFANRQACFFHSSGVILDGKGLIFIGHADVGKSTMIKLLKGRGETLCDERIIVRRWADGFKIHGNWAHGELPEVSPKSAPLHAVFFLEQAKKSRIIPITDKREKISKLLACLIKPLDTADWWNKMLVLTESIVKEVPCYALHFNKSGDIVRELEVL